jgi:hypothetical protein
MIHSIDESTVGEGVSVRLDGTGDKFGTTKGTLSGGDELGGTRVRLASVIGKRDDIGGVVVRLTMEGEGDEEGCVTVEVFFLVDVSLRVIMLARVLIMLKMLKKI